MSELLAAGSKPKPGTYPPEADPAKWLKFLYRIVNERYRGSWAAWAETLSDGALGLLRGCSYWDPTRGSVPAIITVTIRQAICREWVTRWNYRHCLPPLSTKSNTIAKRKAYNGRQLVLFSEVGPWMSHGRNHLFATVEPAESEVMEREEAQRDVEELLKVLPPRQLDVIVRRFGLRGHTPHTLIEVGRIWHLTRERVRQLEARALQTMYDYVKDNIGKVYAAPPPYRWFQSLSDQEKKRLIEARRDKARDKYLEKRYAKAKKKTGVILQAQRARRRHDEQKKRSTE